MKEAIRGEKPTFNTDKSKKFKQITNELKEKPRDEVEERRRTHSNAKYIKEFLPDNLVDRWIEAKVKFVKVYHYWDNFI